MREEPFNLPQPAYESLIKVLEKDIGQDALSKMSRDDINKLAHMLLTLTAVQLKIAIRERGKEESRQKVTS